MKEKEEVKIKKGIRMRKSLVARIQSIADNENRTFGNMVETILLKDIDEREKELISKIAKL